MSRVSLSQKRNHLICVGGLVVFSCCLIGAALLQYQRIASQLRVLAAAEWMDSGRVKNASVMDVSSVDSAASSLSVVSAIDRPVFSSELRVFAIGSGYPIPFDAEVCPFTGAQQPSFNQLDRDSDGMTDDWELKYGLNKLSRTDAALDKDGDGFSNLEEFVAKTSPVDEEDYPPLVTKLRLKKITQKSFKYIFKGVTEQSDGEKFFQFYDVNTGKSVWKGVGEELDGILVKTFIPKDVAGDDRLVVVRGQYEIVLPKHAKVVDPESEVELINMLDQQSIMVTMGALLYLRNDEYTVGEVSADKIIVRDQSTGIEYDVVGLTEEER